MLKIKLYTNSFECFYRFLSLTLCSCFIEDLACRVWFIHTGAYFPWRHLFHWIPLYPAPFLILEWACLLTSAFLILRPSQRRLGIYLASAVIFISLTQRFSNHRSLIFIVLFYLMLSPLTSLMNTLKMIRYQFMIVYLFSAFNKINSGFLSGDSLLALGTSIRGSIIPQTWVQSVLSTSFSPALSWITVFAEIVIPFLIIKKPWLGMSVLVLLHLSFSMLMPGIWPVTFIMIAMGCLFFDKQ